MGKIDGAPGAKLSKVANAWLPSTNSASPTSSSAFVVGVTTLNSRQQAATARTGRDFFKNIDSLLPKLTEYEC
jgi:hypothetical protein